MSAEEQLRRRLAEIGASGGLPRGQESLQVLYMLPDTFLRAYAELFHDALRTGEERKGDREGRDAELGIARRGQLKRSDPLGARTVGGVTSGGKRYKQHWTVRDARALRKKQAVDRKLRALAREMRGGEDKTQTRCEKSGCKKYLDGDWSFCPHCGAKVGE